MSDITYPNKQIAVNPLFPQANEKWSYSDANQVKTAVNSKVDKVEGYGLSENDFTDALKGKLDNIDPSGNTTHQLWLEDLRIEGDTDTTLFKRGIVEMQSRKSPLYLDAREYTLTEHIAIGGNYCTIIGIKGEVETGTRIRNQIPGFAHIFSYDAAVTPILTIPTPTNPASLGGCAFYLTSLIAGMVIENMSFLGFRYGIAFMEAHNAPIFRGVNFFTCNVGIIAYKGCQNFNLINCGGAFIGSVIIAAATCFPAGSPYAGEDGYYCDSLIIKNEDGYGSFSQIDINSKFDDFFRQSILRPSTDSVTIANTIKYLDANNQVYADDSIYANPTGWGVFVPMRNPRSIFGHQYRNIDIRGRVQRGIALLNESVIDLLLEGHFSLELEEYVRETVTVGSVFSATNLLRKRLHSALNFNNAKDIIGFTNRGRSDGFTESSKKYIVDINYIPNRPVVQDNLRFLVFDADKQMVSKDIYEEEILVLADVNSPIHKIGAKITMLYVSKTAQGRIKFEAGNFDILTSSPIDYTKPVYLELEYANPKVLVKIYNKVTAEEWIAQS